MKTFSCLWLMATSMSAGATPPLLGTWKSDAELTMRFNTQHNKLEDRTALFESQAFGHLTVAFDQSTVNFVMPDIETEDAHGKISHLIGFKERHPYQVIGETENSIAIATTAPVTGSNAILMYHFDSSDVMWTYIGDMDGMSAFHEREYFVRQKQKPAK